MKGNAMVTVRLPDGTIKELPPHARPRDFVQQIGKRLAEAVRQLRPGAKVDAVVSPAIGGLIIGHEVGRTLRAKTRAAA